MMAGIQFSNADNPRQSTANFYSPPQNNHSTPFSPTDPTTTKLEKAPPHPIRVNALWLSDIHLGSKDCKAEFLLNMLSTVQCQYLYLVGDIIDIWALKRRFHWPEHHNLVLQKIVELAQNGCQVHYLPGNHDELLKPYAQLTLLNIKMSRQHIHQGISGRKLLMLHGDQFDADVCMGRFYAKLGDHLYDLLMFLNRQLHRFRERLGYPYWSLAGYLKARVSKAQAAISLYRQAVLKYAQHYDVDGVVCGHIHQPELSIHQRGSYSTTPDKRQLIYANDGDWVENCSLLTETLSGELQLCRWHDPSLSLELISSISLAPISAKSTLAAQSVTTNPAIQPRDVA
nr:UDP-2,3-diacylglucosamine diphosphatase [Shewanella acanthi]